MKLNILVILVFCSCNNLEQNNKSHIEFSKENKSIIDSLKNIEYISNYGIVVDNNDERSFYCIDKEIMLKYISNVQDTNQIKIDLKKTKWTADLKSCYFEFYAFANLLRTDLQIITLDLEYCDKIRKSKVIPVYLTEFTILKETELSDLNNCEGKIAPLPFKTFCRAPLNVVYIVPLQNDLQKDFLNIKDTLNRTPYLEYTKFYCH